jgi:hypothetical protein
MRRASPLLAAALFLALPLHAACGADEATPATSATTSSGDSATSTSTSGAGGMGATTGAGGGASTGVGGGSGGGGAGAGGGPLSDGWPARVFAPFVDATAYPTPKLGDITSAAGVKHYALGFIVAKDATSCEATWGTYYDIETGPSAYEGGAEYFLYDHVAQVRAAGGDVLVSFGGAAGTELAGACADVESLVAQYTLVIDQLALTRVDFDIEGFWVADDASNQRRASALAKLQADRAAAGKPLSLWLTLPVLPTGLTADGVSVIDTVLAAGVDLAGVNIMTMDYGDSAAPSPDGQMGMYGIQAATALQGQLTAAHASHGIAKTEAQLWAMVGMTPMIGMNDVTTELFHLSDAAETVDFAKDKGLGWIGMWSINRDHPCPGTGYVALDCSSVADQTVDWAFSSVFLGFGP